MDNWYSAITLPKGCELSARCYQKENGPLTHVILQKWVDGKIKYLLYDVNDDKCGSLIATSQTPEKLYKIIWPDNG